MCYDIGRVERENRARGEHKMKAGDTVRVKRDAAYAVMAEMDKRGRKTISDVCKRDWTVSFASGTSKVMVADNSGLAMFLPQDWFRKVSK